MKNTFDKDYKLMAVNRVKESGKAISEVARELDLSPNTLHGWTNKFGKHGHDAFPGSGHLHEADDEFRKLRKENHGSEREKCHLKKRRQPTSRKTRNRTFPLYGDTPL